MTLTSIQSVTPMSVQKPTLDSLLHLVEQDLKAVNDVILGYLESPIALIPQLAHYLIHAGGKRIRPLLTLASAQLCGYSGDAHVKLAACVEFIHSATLLHDDVVDESSLRRGQKTANEIWGNQASVLVGDFLFSRSFQLMVDIGSIKILSILAQASASIAEGEVLQLSSLQDITMTQDQYQQIVLSKTATLFQAACEVGAVLAEAPLHHRQALTKFGRDIGIAFQLVDDALDYSGHHLKFGKNVGDDFKEGKITLPVVLALEKATSVEKEFWHRTLTQLDQGEEDLNQAIAYMSKYQTIEKTLKLAKDYAHQAKQQLIYFTESPLRSALSELADFITYRVI